jgi:hypothetical protein
MYDGAGHVIDLAGAADAVKWFAHLWESSNFDSAPQDYEFMVKETVRILDAERELGLHCSPTASRIARRSSP